MHVPKYMSCHKAIAVITGRAHYFHDYNLTAPGQTLGHYQGGSLTHPMLITAFFTYLTQRSLGALQWVWVPKPSQPPSGFWTFQFWSQHFNPLGHSPLYYSGGSTELWAWTFIHTSWTLQYVSERVLFSKFLEGLIGGPCI